MLELITTFSPFEPHRTRLAINLSVLERIDHQSASWEKMHLTDPSVSVLQPILERGRYFAQLDLLHNDNGIKLGDLMTLDFRYFETGYMSKERGSRWIILRPLRTSAKAILPVCYISVAWHIIDLFLKKMARDD